MTPPDLISPTDLSLFSDAQAGQAAANATVQFALNHLAKVYGLVNEDEVDFKTGEITRAPRAAEVSPDAVAKVVKMAPRKAKK